MHTTNNNRLAWRKVLALTVLLCCPGFVQAALRVTEAEAKQAATVKPLPEYPAMARQLRITGKVELEVVIAASGAVQEVKIVSGNPILTKQCAKVVGEWKFKPFQEDGKPASATAPLSFDFR